MSASLLLELLGARVGCGIPQIYDLGGTSMCCPFPGSGSLSVSQSCPGHLLYWLLQYTQHETTLEEYSEVAASTQCSHVSSFGHLKDCTYTTSAAWAALGARLLSGPDIGYHLKALHSMGSGYLRNHLVPITLTHPTWVGRKDMLQTSPVEEFQLLGYRKKLFFKKVSSDIPHMFLIVAELREEISPKILKVRESH